MSGDIYLDNAATSWPKPPVVIEAMRDFLENAGGSPGRAGHHRSIASSRAISLAREQLSELLGIESPDELAFTKNATEGLNVAILGFARDGSHVVTTTLEHNSVMRPLRALEQQGRITLDFVHADGNTGEIDLAEWRAAVSAKNVSLAVAVHASNVTGVLLPLADLAAIAKEAGVPFVADTSQSAGHVPLDLSALGVSAAAMPGHKGLLGPMGTGVLYVAPGVEIEPLIRGGTGSKSESEYQPDFTPDRYESGTLNGIGIVALGASATHIAEIGVERIEGRLAELTRRFRDGLADADNVTLYGPADPAAERRHRLGQRARRSLRDRGAPARRRVGRDDARGVALLTCGAPVARHGAGGDDPLLVEPRDDRRGDRRRGGGGHHDRRGRSQPGTC